MNKSIEFARRFFLICKKNGIILDFIVKPDTYFNDKNEFIPWEERKRILPRRDEEAIFGWHTENDHEGWTVRSTGLEFLELQCGCVAREYVEKVFEYLLKDKLLEGLQDDGGFGPEFAEEYHVADYRYKELNHLLRKDIV